MVIIVTPELQSVKKYGAGGVNWVYFAQDKDELRIQLNTVIKFMANFLADERPSASQEFFCRS